MNLNVHKLGNILNKKKLIQIFGKNPVKAFTALTNLYIKKIQFINDIIRTVLSITRVT